jgi:hypothetical protein
VLIVFASVTHLHLMHCTILLSAHSCAFMIDHAEPEVHAEQARVEEFTNLSLDQGKSRCITPILDFYFYVKDDCALA